MGKPERFKALDGQSTSLETGAQDVERDHAERRKSRQPLNLILADIIRHTRIHINTLYDLAEEPCLPACRRRDGAKPYPRQRRYVAGEPLLTPGALHLRLAHSTVELFEFCERFRQFYGFESDSVVRTHIKTAVNRLSAIVGQQLARWGSKMRSEGQTNAESWYWGATLRVPMPKATKRELNDLSGICQSLDAYVRLIRIPGERSLPGPALVTDEERDAAKCRVLGLSSPSDEPLGTAIGEPIESLQTNGGPAFGGDGLTGNHVQLLIAAVKLGAIDEKSLKPAADIAEQAGLAAGSGTTKATFWGVGTSRVLGVEIGQERRPLGHHQRYRGRAKGRPPLMKRGALFGSF